MSTNTTDSAVPPVPNQQEIVEQREGSNKVSIPWMQWFVQLREKVNILNSSIVNLAGVTGTGILTKDGASWFLRTLTGTTGRVSISNGTGAGGDPQIDLVDTGVAPGSYTSANITVDSSGRITAAANGGSGFPSGGAFPGSPSDNDLFFRTDLDFLCYYNLSITSWLTVQEYSQGTTTQPIFIPTSATPTRVSTMPVRSDYGMYITRFISTTYVNSNTGGDYYTAKLNWADAANSETTLANFTTSADTTANWTNHDQAINTVLNASARVIRLLLDKVGTPGTMYITGNISYRLIIP